MTSELDDPDKLVDAASYEPEGLGAPIVCRIDTPQHKADFCEQLLSYLEYAEDGDVVLVKRLRMTVGDIANLPEHEGW